VEKAKEASQNVGRKKGLDSDCGASLRWSKFFGFLEIGCHISAYTCFFEDLLAQDSSVILRRVKTVDQIKKIKRSSKMTREEGKSE